MITVAGSGGGITKETLEKLFLPLYTTKGMTRTGQRLWVSKEIVDRHGGASGCGAVRLQGVLEPCFACFFPCDPDPIV